MHAKITLFAEGCRGSESMKQIDNYDLAKDKCPMTYGIGMKELWRIPKEKHVPGKIIHTAGWPLQKDEYGGSFLYHIEDDGEPLVALGFVIGLDYRGLLKLIEKWFLSRKIGFWVFLGRFQLTTLLFKLFSPFS